MGSRLIYRRFKTLHYLSVNEQVLLRDKSWRLVTHCRSRFTKICRIFLFAERINCIHMYVGPLDDSCVFCVPNVVFFFWLPCKHVDQTIFLQMRKRNMVLFLSQVLVSVNIMRNVYLYTYLDHVLCRVIYLTIWPYWTRRSFVSSVLRKRTRIRRWNSLVIFVCFSVVSYVHA